MSMLEAVLVPSAIFTVVYWLLTFSVHAHYTTQTILLCLVCTLVPAAFWHRVWTQQEDKADLGHREPNWFFFLAAASSVAWLGGFALGMTTWSSYMHKYYDYSDLAVIRGVNTRTQPGGAILDTGVVEFKRTTEVNEDMTMAYKDGDLYCVAPIITSLPETVIASEPATYDYWAIGVNCCDPFGRKAFACGVVLEEQVRGGLRLLDRTNVPSYRKAIQMAEEEYHIKAGKIPLLLYWEGDPEKELERLYMQGSKSFWQNSLAFLCLVTAAMLFWSVLAKVQR